MIIQGQKEVRLFGCDMENMYPNALGTKGRTVQSQVNCDNPDLTEHPRVKNACCYYTTLRPGEM